MKVQKVLYHKKLYLVINIDQNKKYPVVDDLSPLRFVKQRLDFFKGARFLFCESVRVNA